MEIEPEYFRILSVAFFMIHPVYCTSTYCMNKQ